jgi:hypothetical protein
MTVIEPSQMPHFISPVRIDGLRDNLRGVRVLAGDDKSVPALPPTS